VVGWSASALKSRLLAAEGRAQLSRLVSLRDIVRAEKNRRGWSTSYLPYLVRPDQLDDDPWTLVGACLHASGWVREAALGRLAPHHAETVLPFALLRLNDWVPEVRRAAERALQGLLLPHLGKAWLHALPLFEHLARCHRVDRDWLRAFRSRAEQLLSASLVEAGRRTANPDVRRAAWTLALSASPLDPGLAMAATKEKDNRIRLALVQNLARLARRDEPIVLRTLLGDREPSVRRSALGRLIEARPAGWRDDLAILLTDRSGGVRLAARYHLGQQGIDPLAIIRAAVDLAPTTGAVAALAEAGVQSDRTRIEQALIHPNPRVRVAALGGLARLDLEGSLSHLHAALLDSGRVCRVAARILARHGGRVDRALIDSLLDGGSGRVGCAALTVAAALPHWMALPRILRAAAVADPLLSGAGKIRLTAWLKRHHHVWTTPSTAQRVAARLALAEARDKIDPLEHTDLERILEQRS
jgi:hypothetical protein